MNLQPEDIQKILLAIVLGGMIGIEREFRDKAAGFRTIIFICVGAALFTIFSIRIAGDKDQTRIAANIVTGVGFLGAGVLLRNEGRIIGLTTAAIIWLTAAIGMGIGSGHYAIAITSALFMLMILWFFPKIELFINRFRDERIYEISISANAEKFRLLDDLFNQHHLKTHGKKKNKSGNELIYIVEAFGSPQNHDKLAQVLLADPDIINLKC